jgi:hypothetical protein
MVLLLSTTKRIKPILLRPLDGVNTQHTSFDTFIWWRKQSAASETSLDKKQRYDEKRPKYDTLLTHPC